MEQNYSKKNKLINGPRKLVISRILAFSKYYEKNKRILKDSKKETDF